MIFAAAMALAITAAPPLPVVQRLSAAAPRFVRLRLDVVAYGVAGRGEMLIDRRTGRFVRRFDTGPTSEREGFDGARAWRADATGLARVQGNVDQRGAILADSYLFARAPAPAAVVVEGGGARVRYRGVSRALDLAPQPDRPLLARCAQPVGEDVVTTSFDAYGSAAGLRLPFAFSQRSNNGVWTARVTAVEVVRGVTPAAFAPPAPPRDATLTGVTRIALSADHAIEVRIDGGPPLRFMVDTGGQNVITPEAARLLHLAVVGEGRVAGAGASIEPVRFARVRSVRLGRAEMRDQPFLVLELGMGVPFDGIVGYELFARFAARLDLAHETLELAPRSALFGTGGVAVPMTFADRQPQVDGTIDGIPAALTIDTGSAEAVDVNTPFARAHALARRYRAGPREMLYAGVGGEVDGWLTRAREVRLGAVAVRDVRLALTDARAGVEIDPSIAANVGDQVLRRFRIVFDYAHGMLQFEPNAPKPLEAATSR
jgi:predicted aspartyl protease